MQGQPDVSFQLGGPQFVPLVADIFNEGQFRCIAWDQGNGNWCCKAPGKQDFNWNRLNDQNDPKNSDHVFQHGAPGDTPLAHNIFADGAFCFP